MSIEAMKLARAIEYLSELDNVPSEIIHDLQAIEQAEKQEPLAWFRYETVYEYRNQLARCTKDCIGAFPVYTSPPPRQPLTDERLELIGHADLTINNIYVFSNYGEEVPEGRTPIYAGYKDSHGIKPLKSLRDMTEEDFDEAHGIKGEA